MVLILPVLANSRLTAGDHIAESEKKVSSKICKSGGLLDKVFKRCYWAALKLKNIRNVWDVSLSVLERDV